MFLNIKMVIFEFQTNNCEDSFRIFNRIMDEASGFFETPTEAQSPRQGIFELMRSNPESYCEIWRADKDGRFRIYKALKSEYAGDTVYERLLRKEFEGPSEHL